MHKPVIDHNGIQWPNAAAAAKANGCADRTGYSRAESGYMGWRFGEPGEIDKVYQYLRCVGMEFDDCDNHETFSYTVFEAALFDTIKLIGEAERARPKPRNAAGEVNVAALRCQDRETDQRSAVIDPNPRARRPGCQRSCWMRNARRDPPALKAQRAAEANLIRVPREDLFRPDDAALRRKPDRSRARSTPAAGHVLSLGVKVIFKKGVVADGGGQDCPAFATALRPSRGTRRDHPGTTTKKGFRHPIRDEEHGNEWRRQMNGSTQNDQHVQH